MDSVNYMQPILFLILPLICFIAIYVRKKTNKDYNLIFCFGSIFAFIVALIPYGIESGGGTVDFDAVSSMTPFIWIFVVVAGVFLAIPLIQLFLESFEKFKDSFNDVFASNKNSLTLKKESEKVDKSIKKLKQIREMNINAVSLRRTRKLCQLVTMANKDSATQDFDFVEKQFGYLEEAKNIEQSIRLLIQKYMQLGDSKKSTYYFAFLNSSEKSTDEESIENECRALLTKRNENKKTIKKWLVASMAILVVIVLVCVFSYQKNSPYRALENEIKSNSLTVEEVESVYSTCLSTSKGLRIIKSALINYKENNDAEKAMSLHSMVSPGINWREGKHADLKEDIKVIVFDTICNKLDEYKNRNDYKSALKLLDSASGYIGSDDKPRVKSYAYWLADSAIKNHSNTYHCDDWYGDYTAYEIGEYLIAFDSDYVDNKDLSQLNIIKTKYWDFDRNTQAEYSMLKHIY